MLFTDLRFDIAAILAFDDSDKHSSICLEDGKAEVWIDGKSQQGRNQITAGALLDDIARSVRRYNDSDFSYRFVQRGLQLIMYCLQTGGTALMSGPYPEAAAVQSRKLGNEVGAILLKLRKKKDDFGPGIKYRQREDGCYRRRVAVMAQELADRIEDVRYRIEAVGDMFWLHLNGSFVTPHANRR